MEKMRQWSILTAVGVVGVLAAGWFLLVSPQRSHAADLRSQATAQQQSTASLQGQINQLEAQKKGLPAQQRRLAQIATKIPDSPALPVLIRQLSAAAHDADVELVSLAPSQPSLVAGGTAATGAAPAPLAQIPLTLQVTGSYFNVESFFHQVEQLDRAMLVTGFDLSPLGGSSAGPGSSSPSSTGASAGSGAAKAPAPGTLTGQITAVVFESPQAAVPQVATPQVATPQAATPQASPAQPVAPAQ